MSIVLFMMFLFSGLMITLICRFTVFSEYEYTQGMYLGVHIPPEEKGSEIVRPFMEKEIKGRRYSRILTCCYRFYCAYRSFSGKLRRL